jgi:hypothetical protein
MKRILGCLVFISLTACGGGKGGGDNGGSPSGTVSTNADGTCSGQFITDINSYLSSCRSFSMSPKVDTAEAFVAVCDKFTKTHAKTVECTAESLFSYSSDEHSKACFGFGKNDSVPSGRVAVKAAAIHQICERTKDGLAKAKGANNNTPAPAPQPAPAPAPETPAPQASKNVFMKNYVASQISVKILDSKEAEHLVSNSDHVVVNGQVGTIESLGSLILTRKFAICTLRISPEAKAKLEDGQIQKVLTKTESQYRTDRKIITFELEDAGTTLGCTNITGEDYTLDDLNVAYKGILEVILK